MKDFSIKFELLIVLCCSKQANMMGEFGPFLFERRGGGGGGVIFYKTKKKNPLTKTFDHSSICVFTIHANMC